MGNMSYKLLHSFLLDAVNVGDCCHSTVLHCFWKTPASVPKSLLITVIFHCQYFFHVICIQHICSAQSRHLMSTNLQLPPVESAYNAVTALQDNRLTFDFSGRERKLLLNDITMERNYRLYVGVNLDWSKNCRNCRNSKSQMKESLKVLRFV